MPAIKRDAAGEKLKAVQPGELGSPEKRI